MKNVELAQSLAAAMQLRLPGTAGRVARKMRYIDKVAPRFRAGGLIRDVPEAHFERLWTVGVAAASNSIPAFGGVLYGAAALRQDVTLAEGKATPGYQDSQVDVADMTFVQVGNRLVWKEYRLVYSLLEDLFDEATLPDLILLDTRAPHWFPRHDLAAGIVYAAHPSDVTHVMVDGELLMRDGDLLTLDEERIRYEAERRAFRMVGTPMRQVRAYRG